MERSPKEEKVMKTTYEELLKEIEIEEDANGVENLLKSIYGENEGKKLFNLWMSGNDILFEMKVNELA